MDLFGPKPANTQTGESPQVNEIGSLSEHHLSQLPGHRANVMGPRAAGAIQGLENPPENKRRCTYDLLSRRGKVQHQA